MGSCITDQKIRQNAKKARLEYLQLKQKLQKSEEFVFLKVFYRELYLVADKVVEISTKYDQILNKIAKINEALNLFKSIPYLQPIQKCLKIIPTTCKKAIEDGKQSLLNSQASANKFRENYKVFRLQAKQLFSVTNALEKLKISDVKNKYSHGSLVVRFIQERLNKSIRTPNIGQNHRRIYEFVKMISIVDKISCKVVQLKQYLQAQWKDGKTAQYYLQLSRQNIETSSQDFNKLFVQNMVKKILLPIQNQISMLKIHNFGGEELEIYEFPIFEAPTKGWIKGLQFAYDIQRNVLDLISCLPKQWAMQQLGQNHQWVKCMRIYQHCNENIEGNYQSPTFSNETSNDSISLDFPKRNMEQKRDLNTEDINKQDN